MVEARQKGLVRYNCPARFSWFRKFAEHDAIDSGRSPDAAQRVALAKRCVAEPGPIFQQVDPGLAKQHCVLHRARDTVLNPMMAELSHFGQGLAQRAV